MIPALGPAAERWAEAVAGWAVPDRIRAAAAEPPDAHDVSRFVVDDTLDRNTTSTRWAREVLPPRGGTVLDVGCGGGRASLALAPPATEVTGVDPDDAMLDSFVGAARRAGVARRAINGRWPEVAPITPIADVAVCHHVLYEIADIVPFVLALTARARLAVVVEVPARHPLTAWSAGWAHFWSVTRPSGPDHTDLVAVLREIGLDPEVDIGPRTATQRDVRDRELLVDVARRRLCLPAERDDELAGWLADHEPDWVTEYATLRWPGLAEPE